MTEPATLRTPGYARVSLASIMRSPEANLQGNIHGGEILKLADSTAGVVGYRHCGNPVVTAALDEMVFLEPVHVGDIVTTFGEVNWVGHTSMEVGVRIETTRHNDPSTPPLHVASAYFVMVPVDPAGRPMAVPPLEVRAEDERRRWREAEIRHAHRLARREEIARSRRG